MSYLYRFEYAQKPVHKPAERSPFTAPDLSTYAEPLTAFSRPLFFFLAFSGIRVSEACSLTDATITDNTATFTQKGGSVRRLSLDDTLLALIEAAKRARASIDCTSPFLFICAKGTPWNRSSFLKHCQRKWEAAKLPAHVTHELRHAFGTAAGKKFSPDAIKAAMGHAKRETSETYVHPDEDAAAAVHAEIHAGFLPYARPFLPEIGGKAEEAPDMIECPHCRRKFLFS